MNCALFLGGRLQNSVAERVQFERCRHRLPTNNMAKAKRKNRQWTRPPTFMKRRGSVLLIGAALAVTVLLWAGFHIAKNRASPSAGKKGLENSITSTRGGNDDGSLLPSTAPASQPRFADTSISAGSNSQSTVSGPLSTLEVAQAVMVTVELDFGAKLPNIATALLDIERRYQPDDGKGRTFAILDAYGEPTPTGKLHISMHVSTEKPGIGSLLFKRTGETLWSSRIVPSKDPAKRQFSGKNLSIFMEDGAGHLLTIDGSNNPAWIMDAVVKERGALLDTVWPSGVEHEVTFIYSACGCPVKVMARREGDRVVRTRELPVIFPDDPAAGELIARLMRW